MSQNNSSNQKKWIGVGIALVLIALVLFLVFGRDKKSKLTFHEDTVRKMDFMDTILSTGTVSPENRLDIKPPVAGRVEQLLVKEGQRVNKGQVLAWVSSTERAAMLDSARAEGPEALKQWESYYRPTPIYAPINGVIILQNIWPGQSFAITDAILTMSDRLTVKAQVDETDIAKIKIGQYASIVLDAYPKDKLDAKVVRIAFDAKTVNSVTTYIVDVLPDKVPQHMLSGMTANVTFTMNEIPGALMIPSEAVMASEGTACVRIKTESKEPVCKPVQLGPSREGKTLVKSGLDEGQAILVPDLNPLEMKNSQGAKNPFSPMGGGRKR